MGELDDDDAGAAAGGERDLLVDFDPEELALLRQLFRDEAHDALEQVTARAQAAGRGETTADAVHEMMRVTHTLKGSAGTVGLNQVVDLAHKLEGALAAVRSGQRPWSSQFADAVIEIADGIRAHVDAFGDSSRAAATAARVHDLLAPWSEGRRSSTPTPPPTFTRSRTPTPPTFLRRRPRTEPSDAIVEESDDTSQSRSIMLPGSLPASLAADLTSDGVVADDSDATTTTSLPAVDASTGYDGRTLLRVEPERVDELMSAAGELLFDRNRIERRVQLLRTLTRDLGRARQALRDDTGGVRAATTESLRAAIEDRLRAVETQIAALTTQLAQTTAALLDETEAMRRNLGELQRGLTRVRMQTARALFAQLARALRAAARTAGAKVELRTRGEDTEFDKAVAERVTDPLIQILRNAVVHGIEPPAERVLRGKAATGTIRVHARQEGNLVVVEVADDGRGVDVKKLRERFVESGRWSRARAELATDDDVLHALFDPGVSSRDEADELSGRGIGLDLVRETIARLGGEVRMTSAPGRGTTFTLRLPVSTAVSQAMLFKVHGQVYALPNTQVVDTTYVDAGATRWPPGNDGAPVVRLEQLLAVPSATLPEPPPSRRPAVVLAYADQRLVCTVDKLVGPREIVVKQLGPLLAPLPLFAGATISGSGKVQLILDPAALVRAAYPDRPLAPAASADPAPETLAGRALVVDDSRAIREALTSMLAREGWIVDVADDGTRALALVEQLPYDLVVTDLEMPRMGGFELIDRLRAEPRTRATPVVIVSSRVTPETRRRARELAVKGLIAKPITRRKLLEVLYPAESGKG
ncbi:MAG TPA: response regulator [Kofleriaceae bacterium]|nr:response regulator [Kofleriaceae bacterium]